MVAGGDGGQRDMGERQQVTEAFASSIVLKAHRLADYIQGQLARHLSFARKPFLPMWLPDYRTFASTQWAERVVSRVYDTIQSLPGIRHVSSTASVEPSPFVWFQPNRAWSAMPQEDEYMETEQGPAFETTPFTGDSAEPYQTPAARSDGQEHVVSSPLDGATPPPHRAVRPASRFAQPQGSPTALLRRMGIQLGLPTGPGVATSQAFALPTTHPQPVERGESIHPAVEDTTSAGDLVVASSRDESTMTRHDQGPGRSILPQVLARALPASHPSDTLPQVKKVIAFVHRLLGAPEEPPQAQGLTPLTLPTAATDVYPLVSAEEAASTPIARVGPEWTEERMGAVPPGTVSARGAAPGQPSSTGGERQFTAWLHRRRYHASRATPSEQAYLGTEADVEAGLPGPLHAGSELAPSSVAPPPPDLVFPSLPAARPASPVDMAVQAIRSATSQDIMMPQHPPLQQQSAPVSGPLPQTEPATAMAGSAPGAPHQPGGQPQGAVAGPAFALAPLERPQGSAGSSGAAQAAETEETAVSEGTEEAAEANLERLARDVYAVLRRRLAWERDRNMVLIS